MSVWSRVPSADFPVFDGVALWPPDDAAEADNLKEQARKVHEEAGELMVAACDLVRAHGTGKEPAATSRMMEELADLMQALTNFTWAFGVGTEDMERAAYDCWALNSARGRC